MFGKVSKMPKVSIEVTNDAYQLVIKTGIFGGLVNWKKTVFYRFLKKKKRLRTLSCFQLMLLILLRE